MKERFKKYLEEQFRGIRPTEAAMKFRKETLANLLDRAQELKIKGIDDETLIYLTCIDELGNFAESLKEFDEKDIKVENIKRKLSLGAIIAIAVVALLTLTYLIVGLATSLWHPGWLIMVGGIFAGLIIVGGLAVVKLIKNKKFIFVRLIVATCEVLICVFLFLVLQLIAHLSLSYLVFLAMVPLLVGVDTAIAFATNSKTRFLELPAFVEVFGVMLYVILGLTLATSFWHPGWLLCLVGIVFALGEGVVFIARHNKKADSEDSENIEKKYKKEDERYWSEWDD